MLYQLLKGCTFISFDADTILEQIRIHEFTVSQDFLAPFLICKSDYDMESFALVFLQAINALKSKHGDVATSLAKVVLDDAICVWRRGTYYREIAQNYNDSNAHERAMRIFNYVREILVGIKEIFPGSAETWHQYIELNHTCLEWYTEFVRSNQPRLQSN